MSYGNIIAKISSKRIPLAPTGLIKKYVAFLNQASTASPQATIMENTIGPIVWTRLSLGAYRGTLAGAFTEYKTVIFNNVTNGGIHVTALRENANTIIIETRNLLAANANVDSALNEMSLEIRVYY